ncbi:DUF1960-domain-containing protein [Flagelloscypha sp. PMI_526]|nr:DUF1960-domain-containing protein [Flagelloscypha sp. PMI_526]
MGKNTEKALTKVIYKPSSQSTEEYIIIVNPDEFEKYSKGGKSIPLTEVVDSFDVFVSTQGNQGHLGKASNQQLDTVFGTHKDVEVIEQILKKGTGQGGDAIATMTFITNATRGSAIVDSKGKGLSGI